MLDKVSTRELGLVLGARLLKTRDLHYGYWSEDLPLTVGNLPEAQRRYSEMLMGHIPEGVRTILDVGCGTGGLAEQLVERGYRVQCISPAPELTRLARERLGAATPVHATTFEAFQTDTRFDLILFSESFQYISLTDSLPKLVAMLEPGGHVLISDFFLTAAPGESALHGGHGLARFHTLVDELPFQIVSEDDITAQTAPNLDLMDQLLSDYAQPIYEALGVYLRRNHPRIAALGRWLLRRRLEKLEYKYFSHRRSGAEFSRHKNYRVILLKRTG